MNAVKGLGLGQVAIVLTDDAQIMNLRVPTRFASLAYIRGVMRFQQVTKTLFSHLLIEKFINRLETQIVIQLIRRYRR